MSKNSQQNKISNRLRQIRVHLGDSQTVFAERFGLSRDDIANYERGLCDTPVRVLAELDRLGFNLSWVVNGKGSMGSTVCGNGPLHGGHILLGKDAFNP